MASLIQSISRNIRVSVNLCVCVCVCPPRLAPQDKKYLSLQTSRLCIVLELVWKGFVAVAIVIAVALAVAVDFICFALPLSHSDIFSGLLYAGSYQTYRCIFYIYKYMIELCNKHKIYGGILLPFMKQKDKF